MWQSAELHSTETYPKPSKRVKGSTGECRNSRTSSCIFWTLFSHFSQYTSAFASDSFCFWSRCFFLRIGCVLMWLYWVAAPGIHPLPNPQTCSNHEEGWGRYLGISQKLSRIILKGHLGSEASIGWFHQPSGSQARQFQREELTIQGATAKDIFWLVSTTWISQLKRLKLWKAYCHKHVQKCDDLVAKRKDHEPWILHGWFPNQHDHQAPQTKASLRCSKGSTSAFPA